MTKKKKIYQSPQLELLRGRCTRCDFVEEQLDQVIKEKDKHSTENTDIMEMYEQLRSKYAMALKQRDRANDKMARLAEDV